MPPAFIIFAGCNGNNKILTFNSSLLYIKWRKREFIPLETE
jgi:hypothetical protein